MDLHETKFAKSGREIIHIQVGKAGNAIGNQFWKLMCEDSFFLQALQHHRLLLDWYSVERSMALTPTRRMRT
eukprot:s5502_g3.t1